MGIGCYAKHKTGEPDGYLSIGLICPLIIWQYQLHRPYRLCLLLLLGAQKIATKVAMVMGRSTHNLFTNSLAVFILVFGFCSLITTAKFVDLEATQKRDAEIIQPFDSDHKYIQEFISNKPYLSQIEIPLITSGYPRSRNFEVFVQIQEKTNVIVTKKFEIPNTAQEFKIAIPFKPQKVSAQKKYILAIQTNAPLNTVSLLGSKYDSYPFGNLSVNGNLVNYDLAFFTFSKPPPLLLLRETIQNSTTRVISLSLISIYYWVLGYLLILTFSHLNNIIEMIVYPFIIGIAIPPIILFSISLLGIKLSNNNLIVVLIMLLAFSIFWKVLRGRNKHKEKFIEPIKLNEILILFVLFIVAIITRISQINNLIVPSGVGGLAHQKILERIVVAEAIPTDLIYHIGFHTNTFLVYKILKITLPEATLLFGQWLNVISGLSVYLLSRKILKQPLFALFSVAFFWFLSPIPALFVNWSRYPFLQGLTILPTALAFLWNDIKFINKNKLLGGIMLLGLLLSHYGIFLIFITLLLIFFVYKLSKNKNFFSQLINTILLIFIPIVLILIAKLYLIISQGALYKFIQQPHIIYSYNDYIYYFRHTIKHGGVMLWVFGGIGCFLLFLQEKSLILFSLLWIILIAFLDSVQLAIFNHSATRPVNLLYFFFILLPIFSGYALKVSFSKPNWAAYSFITLIVIIGIYNICSTVDPNFVFFSSSDQKAISWIKGNTSPDSLFLASSYKYDGEYKLEDGGGWISYLADRKVVFLESEKDFADLNAYIKQAGVNYIYLGSGYGELANLIIGDQDFGLVYTQEGRYIYKVIRN